MTATPYSDIRVRSERQAITYRSTERSVSDELVKEVKPGLRSREIDVYGFRQGVPLEFILVWWTSNDLRMLLAGIQVHTLLDGMRVAGV